MSLNFFNQASVADGTYVTSTIDRSDLVSAIQATGADDYFDTTGELGKVYVYYSHEAGRQRKRIIHDGTGLTGTVYWSSNARDGTWEKDEVKAFDHDGAYTFLYRSDIGTGEDLDHTNGVTSLNVS